MSDTPTPSLDDRINPISKMELMVQIRGYWTTASGEPELGEFADYVLALIKSEQDRAVEAFAAELKLHSYNANSGIDDATAPYLAVGVDDIDQALIERTKHE